MMWGYGQGMWWMWLWGPLLLIGIALLVLLAVWVSRGGTRQSGLSGQPGQHGQPGQGPYPPPNGPYPPPNSNARAILDERFARGELTADQYREHIRVLNEGR